MSPGLRFAQSGLLLVATSLLSGCYQPLMIKGTPGAPAAPAADEALITFVRPQGYYGENEEVGIFDGYRLVGILRTGTLVQYRAKSGRHMFLCDAPENWSYARANLAAGKKYFVKINMFPGFLSSRCALGTVPKNDDRVTDWLKRLQVMLLNPEATEKDYGASRGTAVKEALDKFNAGTVTSFAEVKPDDGR